MKIVVVAFQLHYSAGSECSVAMDFARNMSKYHHITMLYGACRQFHKIGDTKEMEEWTANNQLENVRFIPVKPTFKSKDYGYSMLGNVLFYREYGKWHKELRAFICNLIANEKFDLIHYLGPIGYHEPGYLTGIGIPVIWGPIGGFETVNLKLIKPSISYKSFLSTIAKNTVNKLQYRFDKRVKQALSESDVVIFAVSRYLEIIEPVLRNNHKSKFLYIPENCISHIYPVNESKFDNDVLNLIFIGRLDYWKGLYFIIEALKLVKNTSSLKLHVIGNGPLKRKFKEISNELSDIIVWHGSIPREEVIKYLNNSHLMVLPSVLDANTTVVWEAMSVGVPTLAFDHCGFHDTIIDGETGFLIHPGDYNDAVNDIANVLNNITEHPQIMKEMAKKVMAHRDKYIWDKRAVFFTTLYDSVVKKA